MAKFKRERTQAADNIKLALDIDGIEGKVGWFEGAKYEDGTPVAQVAFWNEFGTSDSPPRPFMRPTVSEREGEWRSLVGVLAKRMIEGRMSPEDAVDALTLGVAGDVRKKISSIHQPPLKKSTIDARRRKLSKSSKIGNLTKPLVETGLMIGSLQNTVEK